MSLGGYWSRTDQLGNSYGPTIGQNVILDNRCSATAPVFWSFPSIREANYVFWHPPCNLWINVLSSVAVSTDLFPMYWRNINWGHLYSEAGMMGWKNLSLLFALVISTWLVRFRGKQFSKFLSGTWFSLMDCGEGGQ